MDESARIRSITEEELLNSGPEYIYSWLKQRFEKAGKIESQPDHLETSLLTLKKRLVELGIAQFGIERDALSKLFESVVTSNDKTLVPACLSNRAVGKAAYSWDGIPTILFRKSTEEMLPWLSKASEEEIVAIFQNEAIDDDFLAEFLEQKVFLECA